MTVCISYLALPALMLKAVVDVSHWQDSINTVAAQGIVGMFHKATQATQSGDSRFRSRKPLALSAGLLWAPTTSAPLPTAPPRHFPATACPRPPTCWGSTSKTTALAAAA